MSSCYFYDNEGNELGFVANDSSVLGSNEFVYKEDEVYNFSIGIEGSEDIFVTTVSVDEKDIIK